jgi:hypothetical protein
MRSDSPEKAGPQFRSCVIVEGFDDESRTKGDLAFYYVNFVF